MELKLERWMGYALAANKKVKVVFYLRIHPLSSYEMDMMAEDFFIL